ncbi:aldo/keto reductase [Streptosporangium canum]|uniref:aldo/keto reductase n=1 Tax=Streptosporangium canum TaxID=324952 RepID=UPI0033AF0479
MEGCRAWPPYNDAYGPHTVEDLIRRALHPYPEQVLLATKVGMIRPGPNVWKPLGRPDYLRAAVEACLRRLAVDRLDLCYLHRTDTLAPYLLDKYRSSGVRVDRVNDQAAWQRVRINIAGSAVSGLVSALMWAGVMVLLGTATISAAAAGTLVFALRAASSGLYGIVGYGSELMRTGRYLDDWEAFVQEAAGQRLDRGTIVPDHPRHVALHQVTHRYPEADADTPHEMNFEVRQGEIVAVVGENGSGKTTLMKLLSGLNLPTCGVVTWDSVSTRDLEPHALWKQCAVVPQEFARWPMTARENIQLGQPQLDMDKAIHRAATASGADAVIKILRSGLGTLLARE